MPNIFGKILTTANHRIKSNKYNRKFNLLFETDCAGNSCLVTLGKLLKMRNLTGFKSKQIKTNQYRREIALLGHTRRKLNTVKPIINQTF